MASSWFAAPAPIRNLFNHFPLQTLSAEPLPARTVPLSSTTPTLYIFAHPRDIPLGRPSYNPSCLKWQTILRVAGVPVTLASSSNHASPSGALPFLLAPQPSSSAPLTLTGEKIGRFAETHTTSDFKFAPTSKTDAYQSLIAQSIRPAWLYNLYILSDNDPVLTSLYLPSTIIAVPQRKALRDAATAEILKTTRRTAGLDPLQLLQDAEAALEALATRLGDNDWFEESNGPGILDAEVFAYTHLILDDSLGWVDLSLANCLSQYTKLVDHRNRMLQTYWGE